MGTKLVSLIHDRPTADDHQPIIETIVDPLFFVIGMLGGAGNGCAVGGGCQIDDDGESHACNT